MVTAKSAKLFYRQVLVNLVHGNGLTKMCALLVVGHMAQLLMPAGLNDPVGYFVGLLAQGGSR